MRSSQLCLVSSMAAHSSPRGGPPPPVNTSSGMRTSSLPIPFSPSASASRRAGSTVSTSTRPPVLAPRPWRRAPRRWSSCPPPRPAGDDDLLGREQLPDRSAARRRARVARHQYPSSSPSALGHLVGRAQDRGPGEELGQQQDGQAVGQAGLEPLQMVGPGPAQGDGETGRLEHRGHRARRPAPRASPRLPGSRSCSNTSSSRWPKSSGSTRLTTTADMRTVVSSAPAPSARGSRSPASPRAWRRPPGPSGGDRRGCRASSRSGCGSGPP